MSTALPFFNSPVCRSRKACDACRNTLDATFRRSLVITGQVDREDFVCTNGETWREVPDPDAIPSTDRGLGDTIARFTHATGIAQAVKAISAAVGVPCGCAGRQEALNRALPYEG